MESQDSVIRSGVSAIVVDDNKDVRDVFTELLEINGINVIGNGINGKEGFELYRKFHPDIVFMDAMMDEYDGFYGIEKIREYDSKAKVVLVTGSVNVEDRLDGCLVTAILEKPIDMAKIRDIVNTIEVSSKHTLKISH